MKKLNFISNQVTAGKGTAESESTQKRVKIVEGYIQQIFSIYSAYIGTSRQPAGAQQTTSKQPRPDCVSILCRWSDLAMSGLFSTRALRYAAMILCVLTLGVGQMWGADISNYAHGWEDNSTSAYTNDNATLSISSEARTGTKSLQTYYNGTGDRRIETTATFAVTTSQTMYAIGYAKLPSGDATAQSTSTLAYLDCYLGGGSTYTSVQLTTSWQRMTAYKKPGSNQTGKTLRIQRKHANKGNVLFDDIIVYVSTESKIDLKKPGSATSANATTSSITWTPGTDASDSDNGATGVQATLIFHRTGGSVGGNDLSLNDQGIYSLTSTEGPSVVGNWTLLSASVAANAESYSGTFTEGHEYAIVHRDLAYNYSSPTYVTVESGGGGGGGATTYDVNIANMTNGSVSASPTSAEEGETVTLTVTPSTGYELATLTVTGDESSDEVDVDDNEFSMPAEDVTVSATFSLIDYTVSKTLTNCAVKDGSSAFPSTLNYGDDFSTIIEPTSGNLLPGSITVSGVSSYTWNALTGDLTLTDVTGNVSVSITAATPQTGTSKTITYTMIKTSGTTASYSSSTFTNVLSGGSSSANTLVASNTLKGGNGVGVQSDKTTANGTYTAGITTSTSDFAVGSTPYVEFRFDVVDGYTFTPTGISVPVQPISKNAYFKILVTDGSSTWTTTSSECTQGTLTTITTAPTGGSALTGTVYVRVYCYSQADAVKGYRFGTPITITGTVAVSCTNPTTTFADGDCVIGSPLDLRHLVGSVQGDGAVTFSVKNANGTGASIAGDGYSLSATTSGTCTITATQAADATNGYCEKTIDATITVCVAKRIYMKCGSTWCDASPKFFVRSWYSTRTYTALMTLADCETDVYYADIPSDHTGLLFTRQKAASTWIVWSGDENFLNQSQDITISTNDLFTCTGWSDSKGTFSGSTYSAPTYTISYNVNGGSGSMDSETGIECGGSQTLTTNDGSIYLTGWTFTGWNTEKHGKGTAYADGASVTGVTANITLYAQWEKEIYMQATGDLNWWYNDKAWFAIYYWDNAASSNNGYVPMEAESCGTNIYKATIPGNSYTHLLFLRMDQSAEVPSTTTGKNNQTGDVVYPTTDALFTINGGSGQDCSGSWGAPPIYTITFDANGGTGTMEDVTHICSGEDKTLPSNTFTRSGWEFDGWNTNKYGTGASYDDEDEIEDISADITLYAQWKKTVYLKSDPSEIDWWYNDNAWFAIYYWDDSDKTKDGWAAMSKAETCSDPAVYKATLPGNGYDKVIFARMDKNKAALEWASKNNQTVDVDYPTDDDMYIVTGTSDGKQTGSWDTYEAPTFTISYAGGEDAESGERDDETKICDESFTLPSSAVFTWTNHKQTGWATEESGAKAYELGGSYTTNADQEFYPFWTEKSTPTKYNLSGSSDVCGESTATIILANSQTGVTYELYKNGSATGDTKAGSTGSMLQWTGQTAGSYTIYTVETADYKGGIQMDNEGYTTVIVTALPTTAISTQPETEVEVEAGENFTLGTSMVTAGSNLTYRWLTCSSTGTDTTFVTGATSSTYTTSKTSGTYYYCVKVSGDCGDPVISDVITVTVTAELTALEAGTLYQAQDMANVTFITDTWFAGLSSNARFQTYGNGTSNSAKGSSISSTTVGDASFTSKAYIMASDVTSGSSDPTYGAIEIITPSTAGLLYIYTENGSNSQLTLRKKGTSTFTALNSSTQVNAILVDADSHYFINGSGEKRGIYGVKFIALYSITLDDNGDYEGNGSAKIAPNGKTLLSLSAPTRTGYDVEGYYGEAGCTNKVADASGNLQASVTISETAYTNSSKEWTKGSGATLYAKWTPAVYTVTLDANGGTINSGDVTSYTYGTGATLPVAGDMTAPTGGVFLGWYDGEGTKVTAISNSATGDKSYKAKWGYTLYDSYFYQTYNASSKTNDQLTADFPVYMDKSIANSANSSTPDKASSVTTPHDFSANGTTSCYNLKITSGTDKITLSALADVRTVRFYGWATSNRTITTTAKLVSGTGSDLTVANVAISSLSSPNRTITEYTVNIGGASGYSSANYYDYTFTFSGETRIWGIYVEKYTNVPVTGVSLNKSETTITVGETETLTATLSPANATNKGISWTSDDKDVATVSGGVVTAVAEGTATITATTSDGSYTATCDVTVEAFNCAKYAGKIFDLTVTSSSASGTIGGGTEQSLSSSTTIMDGCSAYMGKLGSSASASYIGSTKLKLDVSSGQDKYAKITAKCALRNGDVISCTGSSQQLAFSTTATKVSTPATSSYSYTVTQGDGLAGASTIYVWGASSSATVSTLTITRPTSYVLTYDVNGGRAETAPDADRFAACANVLTTDRPIRSGYVCAGWTEDVAGEETLYRQGTVYTMGAANKTLYAQWKKPEIDDAYASDELTGTSSSVSINCTSKMYNLSGSGPYKLNNSTLSYYGITLANGNFKVGDEVTFKMKRSSGSNAYVHCDFTGTTVIFSRNDVGTTGDYLITFTVTQAMLDAGLTNTMAMVRNSTYSQNHEMYWVKVKRDYCDGCMAPKDDVTTWSTTASDWIGQDGISAALPGIDDVVYLNNEVSVPNGVTGKAAEVILGNDGKLDIAAGGALVVAGSVTKMGGEPTDYNDINIGSTLDDGTGALVMGSHDGTNKATVNFASKAKKDGSGNWINQFIGTPYNDVTDVQYNYYGMQLYEFRAAHDGTYPSGNTNEWTKLRNGNGMTAFMGYNLLCKQTTDQTLWMQGTLVTSANQTLSGYQKADADSTENMFANSWLAPIHMDQFEDDDFTNIEKTIYIFNAGSPADQASHTSDGSATATAAGQYIVLPIKSATWLSATVTVIPSMQAFSVYAKGSSPSLKLDYSRLVYTPALTSVGVVPTRAPRKAKAETDAPDKLRLTISAESGYGANIYVFGREDFSEGFDDGWDGRHIAGDDAAPQLYAVTADGNMAIHCTPELEGTLIGFKAGEADSEYTFAFEYDGDAEALYLLDTYTNAYTRVLTGNSYHFGASDNAAHNRFILTHYAPGVATGVENGELLNGADGVRKVLIDDQLYIFRAGKMFNATGALVK